MVCELAKENFKAAQEKMKCCYDQKAKQCVFCPRDQILGLFTCIWFCVTGSIQ